MYAKLVEKLVKAWQAMDKPKYYISVHDRFLSMKKRPGKQVDVEGFTETYLFQTANLLTEIISQPEYNFDFTPRPVVMRNIANKYKNRYNLRTRIAHLVSKLHKTYYHHSPTQDYSKSFFPASVGLALTIVTPIFKKIIKASMMEDVKKSWLTDDSTLKHISQKLNPFIEFLATIILGRQLYTLLFEENGEEACFTAMYISGIYLSKAYQRYQLESQAMVTKNLGLKPRPNASGTATPRGRLCVILNLGRKHLQ